MKHKIILFGEPTGKETKNGEREIKYDYLIQGEEVDLFCMLCDIIHKNPEFRKMVTHALKFNKEHDFENCPFCNQGKKN